MTNRPPRVRIGAREHCPAKPTLRRYAWIEANRRRVDAASGGRIGYIYVPNTGIDGQTNEALSSIPRPIHQARPDHRRATGIPAAKSRIDLSSCSAWRPTAFWGVRDGRDWQTPFIAHSGPKAILANGWSGSGGDCFPWLFRQSGLGPIIGQRTWGGLIGITGTPQLIDGGSVTCSTFSIYDATGQWIIEGRGVEPDIAVIDDPAALAKGIDPQLERAIEEVTKEIDAKSEPSRRNRSIRSVR